MELIQNRVSELSKTSDYTFKSDIVKEILKEFKKDFSKNNFEKAVDIDKKKHPVYINFEDLNKIIDEQINIDKFNVKFTTENIIDGYGNIVVSFNGNPYITLKLALMALRTHNNIIFFSKKYYAINSRNYSNFKYGLQKTKLYR